MINIFGRRKRREQQKKKIYLESLEILYNENLVDIKEFCDIDDFVTLYRFVNLVSMGTKLVNSFISEHDLETPQAILDLERYLTRLSSLGVSFMKNRGDYLHNLAHYIDLIVRKDFNNLATDISLMQGDYLLDVEEIVEINNIRNYILNIYNNLTVKAS